VRQFFANGGAEAIVVRTARDPLRAERPLTAAGVGEVLVVRARDAGESGNFLRVAVAHSARTSAFDWRSRTTTPGAPAERAVEVHRGLSMRQGDPRYVVDVLAAESALVTATRTATDAMLGALPPGTSVGADLRVGGALPNVRGAAWTTSTATARVGQRGAPVRVTLDPTAFPPPLAGRHADRDPPGDRVADPDAGARRRARRLAAGQPHRGRRAARAGAHAPRADGRRRRRRAVAGARAPGATADVSGALGLGEAGGGREVDAVASLRRARGRRARRAARRPPHQRRRRLADRAA
jgi:hypothetical protein